MTRLTRILAVLAILLPVSLSHASSPVKVGAKVLHDSGYQAIGGKRVGLITNHSALV